MKDSDFKIKHLGEYPVEEIKKLALQEEDSEIDKYSFNKHMFPVHRRTKSFPILWTCYGKNVINNQKQTIFKVLKFQKYFKIIEELEKYVSIIYPNSIIIRAHIAILLDNSKIPTHIDDDFNNGSLTRVNRIHIPIITNEKVKFTVDDETQHFKEGNLYEINNLLPHSVKNSSNEKRIHLIIDVLDNFYLPEGVDYVDINDDNLHLIEEIKYIK